ncbi:MAG: SDR family oxidoreductase [Bacteroidota bacterium]
MIEDTTKVVLITGASSGLGKRTAQYLAAKGMRVYGTARNATKHTPDASFELLSLDVTKPETITEAIAYIVNKEGRIDVLVNNAGMGITGPLEETPLEEIQKVFDVNLYGPLRMIQAVLPHMRAQAGGLVINITSIAGFMGLPFRGVYSATKGALELITETLRMETKSFGVKVTAIAPGDFATNIAAGRYHAPVKEGSAYQATYQSVLDGINGDVDQGEDPVLVAQKVYQVITKSQPKVRYAVGVFLQKLSLLLKKILPGNLFERLLLNHYKL